MVSNGRSGQDFTPSRAWSKSHLLLARVAPLLTLRHRHLHLHVLSNDLCSEKMKHKKHYNSFHPNLGYFLHLDEVLSWFDEDPAYFARVCDCPCVDIASLMYPYLCRWSNEKGPIMSISSKRASVVGDANGT